LRRRTLRESRNSNRLVLLEEEEELELVEILAAVETAAL
jgi:hypothetical protein